MKKTLSMTPNAIAKRLKRAQAAAAKLDVVNAHINQVLNQPEIASQPVMVPVAEIIPQPIPAPVAAVPAPVPVAPIVPIEGEAEASEETVKQDNIRAQAQAGNEQAQAAVQSAGMMPFVEAEDALTCTVNSNAWNRNEKNTVPVIELKGAGNLLAAFDYVPTMLFIETANGRGKVPYSILTCSDNGKVVGKPFNPSTYSLLGNQKFLDVIGQITAQLDKLGLKWEIVTTGTLFNRERQFLTVRIADESLTSINIDGREFRQFINCLNSIPSNAGCTVTFANNSFCVCCRNTFSHCLHGADGTEFHVALKHTNGLGDSLADVPVLVEAFFASNAALFANLKRFQEFAIPLEMAEQYFAAFIGRDKKDDVTDKTALSTRSANIVETLKGLFVNGKGNKGQTALDLFQAVTEYYTHFSAGETDNAMKQFQSSEVGSGSVAKGVFYSWLVKHSQGKADFDGIAKVGNTLLVNYRKAK